VPFTTRYFFVSIITARSFFSVVLTDWLSMIAALGVGHVCGINAVALFQRNHGNPTCVSFRVGFKLWVTQGKKAYHQSCLQDDSVSKTGS